MNDELFTHDHFRFSSPPSRPSREINLCSTTVKSRSEKSERQLNFGLKPALSMNLDFNGTQSVLVYGLHLQLVVTTALILTFSPGEKGQRLHASLYSIGRRANPVAGAWWFRVKAFISLWSTSSWRVSLRDQNRVS